MIIIRLVILPRFNFPILALFKDWFEIAPLWHIQRWPLKKKLKIVTGEIFHGVRKDSWAEHMVAAYK
jgi:hypothetical protein